MSKALLGLRIAAGICALSVALFRRGWRADETVARRGRRRAPASLMWVGNSFFYYNNSMHKPLRRIGAEVDAGQRYRSVSVTISGSGIDCTTWIPTCGRASSASTPSRPQRVVFNKSRAGSSTPS